MRETIMEGNGFVVREDGEAVAEITFVPSGEDALVIDHTYVSEALRGQKIAEDLVKRVVEYARETNKQIIPACSYALAQFRRHKEYQDIWKQ
ncbi:GNAT family N-acetyltransferase [Paenibacillus nasutitermitis]|uniref:N-acetyltransferase n=1 Tax=Paenibacillus nasutitermitis TaxID=1652958 RepID=A0A916ZIC9_9BACL|nr:GNAT family N-acetyltransferase [Paenibacillus nasutitermitis]GGD97986.1 N-acetyltransferase [Paenibacillus nasutitermitis]